MPSARHASSALYVLAWLGTLAAEIAGWRLAGDLAGMAILGFLLLQFPHQRRYAQVLFVALCVAGLAGVAAAPDPLVLFLRGWRHGARYAAFFLALTALRDAAETSKLVRRCGAHLVAQPPGRRYAALNAGGHVFGIILSYGAIDLLGAMVARANAQAAAQPNGEDPALRGRRMLMAIYRGFCVMNCWSPLNIMTAVVSTAVPGAPMRLLLPAAFAVSVAMSVLGWAEDRQFAPRRAAAAPDGRTRDGWSIHLGIIALVALVMILAESANAFGHLSLVAAVTLIVPLVGFGWQIVQTHRLGPRRQPALLARRGRRYLAHIPGFRGEATVLAASGFMGTAIGGVLAHGGAGGLLAGLPPILVPLAVPVVLIATGQIGLNPVAVVALLGAAIPHPGALGIPPACLAFAYMLSWGMGIGMTPMSASAITTARWAGVSPFTVSTIWNLRFTAGALVLTWAAIAIAFAAFTAG
ncbi:MAG: hypothetical protein KGL12_01755 [Rhodospirillales bacterium]|nr:hypothetical protein [Rhodospirillales bacterium]